MGWLGAILGGVVGFFVGGPVGAVIGAGLGATKVGEKVVNTVLDFVLQPFMGALGVPDQTAGAGEAERQQGILVQRTGSVSTIPVVYGYRKVGGAITFAETGSTNNKYLYVAYVFSEGVVEGLREVYIDDWLLPVDQVGSLNAGQQITINADRYKDRVQLQWFPGIYYTNPRSSTVGSTVKNGIFSEAPSFTSNMNYNGLAVLFARYEWKEIKTQADSDANPFNGGIPEVQVAMLGKRVASLLVDSTETVPYDSNIVRYSTNPAEILLDYLRNPRYGKGLTNNDIDWTTWKQSSRKCNQTVTYLANQSIQGPILTMNYVVDTTQTLMANTKNMLMNFRAYMPYVQGKYKLRIEDAGNDTDILSGSATIVQTFTKDDIVSDVTYNGIERSSKYNQVSVTYVDPDQKFSNQQVVYPETEAERQIYIDKDGGRENKQEVTFAGITNYAIAKDMARLLFNKSRRQESVTMTVTSKALELEPGDCIRIQSNILNFGTDPWRIVSFKVNDDMTVDLGCVRNPDDIYPYTRVGEEDVVLPTYIPKGSIIYYPSSDNLVPLGLVPPINAVFPPSTTPVTPLPTNPYPTDPNGSTGGGVGGGTPNGGSAGPTTSDPTVPVPPTNNPATPAPKPAPFTAVLTLKSTRATVDTVRNSADFDLVFTQPSDGLYDRATFWWRSNRQSSWVPIEITTKPGAGGDIPVTIRGLSALYFTPYEYFIRCFATDGRPSDFVTQGSFQLAQNQTTGNIVGTGTAGPVQGGAGWTLPATEAPPAPVYNDSISYLTIQPLLSGGVPQEPRRMSVTIQQCDSSMIFNSGIMGFTVYYRFKGDTYWSYESFKFSDKGISALQQATFDLAGDFGTRGYPGAVNDAAQQYEFLVRLTYTDNTTAKKQMGPGVVPVEKYNGLNAFTAFGTTATNTVGQFKSLDIPAGFTLLTVDNDPNKAVTSGSTIEPVVTQIVANPTISKLIFYFKSPTAYLSKFRGYKIKYREIVPGTTPAYTEIVVGGGTVDPVVTIEGGTYKHGSRYEWVITAQYSLSGVTTDCVKSLYSKTLIPMGVSSGTNSVDAFNFAIIDTTLALGNLKTSFPATPTPNPRAWIKKQVKPYASGPTSNYGSYQGDVYTGNNGVTNYLNAYYQLQFQPNSSSTHIVVYRRVYDAYAATKTTVTSFARYWGLGPWEKKSIALSSLSTDAAGFKILNVRGPISPEVFTQNYEVVAGKTLLKSYYGPSPAKFYVSTSEVYGISDVYPYHGVGNNGMGAGATKWVEFIFVLATSGTEETQGLRLKDFYTAGFTSQTDYVSEVDGITAGLVVKDDVVSLSTLNSYTAGYYRNINEAITATSIDKLNVAFTPGLEYPAGIPRSSNYTTMNNVLQSPSNGDTVY
jgi:hypothetical protein